MACNPEVERIPSLALSHIQDRVSCELTSGCLKAAFCSRARLYFLCKKINSTPPNKLILALAEVRLDKLLLPVPKRT